MLYFRFETFFLSKQEMAESATEFWETLKKVYLDGVSSAIRKDSWKHFESHFSFMKLI